MTGKWIAGLSGFLVISVAIGILASVVFIPAVATSVVVTESGAKVLDAVPDKLEIPELSERSYMYASDGTTLLATFYDQNRVVVGLDQISLAMQHAVVALEDRRFYEHSGVDVQGMARAFINNSVNSDDIQGASTLTQQFVKNSLIQQAELTGDTEAVAAASAQSYARKLREAKMAVEVERKFGKDKVLEGYLNIAQFGPSLYGVEAAANYYFNVKAIDLTVVQAATIAAITQKPNGLDPKQFPEENRLRRDYALAAMLREKYITQEEYDEAINVDVTESLSINETSSSCEAADVLNAGFFCDYVLAEMRNSEAFGEDVSDRMALIQRGGLRIVTTIDLNTQNAAVNAIQKQVKTGDESGVAQALSAVEPGTGRIKAMAQNRHYKIGDTDDATYTAINYNVDRAYGGSSGFQPGSTFKPFILAQWLTAGHALRETFDGSKTVYTNDRWPAKCMDGGSVWVKEWRVSGGARKNNTAWAATQNSMNASYAAMERKLDLCEIRDLVAAMGVDRADGAEWQLLPSMVLGVNEVSPLSMAGAYATFASGGVFCKPTAIESVTDSAGNAIATLEPQCQRVLDEGVANGVSKALTNAVNAGTGTNARLPDGRVAAGKTGTTDKSAAAWFCGYTPQLATAIWTGHPGSSKVLSGRIGDTYYGEAFGGQLAAPVFKWFMSAALEGQEKLTFGSVPTLVEFGKKIAVPSVVGMDPKAAQKKLEEAGFTVAFGTETVASDTVAAGLVAEQDPAGTAYGGSEITLKLSTGPAAPPPSQPPPTTG
jgi:membrane peptidoglycan carboxypeptidase